MSTRPYCGEMGRSPSQLLGDWLHAAPQKKSGVSDGRCIAFTDSGRSAILLAARLWKLGPDDEVLAPAYNCGSEISPLMSTGAKVVLYRVNARAEVDHEDILNRITARTRVLYFTHYFGRYTDLSSVIDICRARNIRILEDSALALFSKMPSHYTDATIFSLRKSLPVFDGGILLTEKEKGGVSALLGSADPVSNVRGSLSLIKKWSRQWFTHATASSKFGSHSKPNDCPANSDIPSLYYCSSGATVRRASRASLGMLARTDPLYIRAVRRRNYDRLWGRLTNLLGVTLLWPDELLPEGICPLGLPIIVDDRIRWCTALNAAGVDVSQWWKGYHRGLDWSEFPEARRLKEHLLLLPVHQGLTARHIDYIASVVESIALHESSRHPASSAVESFPIG